MNAFRSAKQAFALATAFSLLCTGLCSAQSDDFDDNNADGWTGLDPLGITTFSAADGNYRITSGSSPNPALGGARAAGMRQDVVYTDFCIVVDIVNFDSALEQSFGIIARVGPNPALGAVNGYVLTVQPMAQGGQGDLDITRVTGEMPEPIDASEILTTPLNAENDYRMVFIGRGSNLEGRLYDLNDLLNPIVVVTGNDATYGSGTCGVVVTDLGEPDGSIDCTFDNYHANAGTPPQMTIEKDAFDEGLLSWPDNALCFRLETSTTLAAGSWTEVVADIRHRESTKTFFVNLFFFDGDPVRYWRLVFDGDT